MRSIKCVWVGKLKARHWQDAADHYLAAVRRSLAVVEKTVKDAPGKLPPDKRREVEGESILGCLGRADLVIALDHQGKTLDSPGLADFLAPPVGGRQPRSLFRGGRGLWAVGRGAGPGPPPAQPEPHDLSP